ncbi:response regulator transcription factor [Paenisporosarcina sp. OV554]|uniref:response regulator transcription factor n=1 Tax=Paenisporosarcina sp. OV554 TaxID=2135694 RepID=UPI000D3766CE|nr:response regulator transcription factor [Paenisporosarcina sp. OV554]PUB13325.1 DNA-binding response OmpR family regulator [Paenisporosarcina sp. OV554]
MRTILLVDDDPNILTLMSIHLTKAGYRVEKARDAESALKLIPFVWPHVVVVDVMMPGMDGFSLTKKIRDDFDLPVILVTAKSQLEDKEKGFLAGSDDYVVKPFEPQELLFRIGAVLRRSAHPNEIRRQVGSLIIDRKKFDISNGTETKWLPLKEFELLALLASSPGNVFLRSGLMEQVWGYDYPGDEQTLSVHIKRLRERLNGFVSDVQIVTVRGIGYKLEARS